MLFNAVERPLLLNQMREGLARQMVIVHSPPGFGKTALLKASYDLIQANSGFLTDALTQDVAFCGWLTLAPSYCDKAGLLADLHQALGLDRPVDLLDEMLEMVARRPGCTVLFLDELDVVSQPDLTQLLSEFFLTAPDNLRIVGSFRQRPRLPLARLAVRGLTTEITAHELAFTRAELRQLFPRSATVSEVEDFAKVTRGWPALTQITGDLLPSISAASERRALLDGNHPRLHTYVTEVVSGMTSDSLHHMLRASSLLEEFSLELANFLSDARISSSEVQLLDDLYPLVEKSKTDAGWYRLHPVLRKCLEADLFADPHSNDINMHCQAALWFAERGMLGKAVSHAARGGNFSLAAHTIRQAGGVDLFIRAGHTVLESLIGDLPAGIIHDSPSLTLCYVLVLAKRGNLQAARERMEALRKDHGLNSAETVNIPSLTLDHIEGMLNIYEDRNLDARIAKELEVKAAALAPNSTWDLGWINNYLCIAYKRMGLLDQARRAALKGLGCYHEEKTIYAEIFMLVHLGLVHTLTGNFSAALAFCRQAEELGRSAQWKDSNLDAICKVAAATVHYQQGDIALVEKTLSEAINPIVRGEGWVEIYSNLFSLLARARLRLAGLDMAMCAIDKAEEVAIERNLPRLKIAADIMRVEVFCRSGLIESAVAICERLANIRDEAMADDIWTWCEENDFHLARARLFGTQAQHLPAMADLDAIMERSRENGSGYHLLAAEVLATKVMWDSGQYAQSLEYLQSAIARARSHEAIQFFVDEGPDFAVTLRAIVRRFGLKVFSADGVDFISRVIGQRALLPGERGTRHSLEKATATTGWGLLSPREQEVLLLLRKGKSNKEIARDLDISEVTVKFHLKNIFAKLGVSNRTMAISVSNLLPTS